MVHDRFAFTGLYRTQSRRTAVPSELHGVWFSDASCLTAGHINTGLRSHSLWNGRDTVRLRAALVEYRSGDFSRGDALYYSTQFSAGTGSATLAEDVLDLDKLESHWRERKPFLQDLLVGDCYEAVLARVDARLAANDEYFCHEGGHRLGVSIEEKYRLGYFAGDRAAARTAIFVEEFRADIESLGFATTCVDAARAAQVFVYQVCHRLGLAGMSRRGSGAGVGLVPWYLYATLREVGALKVVSERGRPRLGFCYETTSCLDAVRACLELVRSALTLRELDAPGSKLVAGEYAARFRLHSRLEREFSLIVAGL